MGTMKKIIMFIWQLPQHLVALALWAVLFIGGRLIDIKLSDAPQGVRYIGVKSPAVGVCLGSYIFIGENRSAFTVFHEYGHSRQSWYLGPLYLLTVGLYSAVFCYWWDRWFHKTWPGDMRYEWYYSRWCEAWADRLGGVKRNY